MDVEGEAKRKRDINDNSDEHRILGEDAEHEAWAREMGLRYVGSNKEKWGDIESEDENTKWTNDLSYMAELHIMEMTCEEKHDDQWDTCFEDGKIKGDLRRCHGQEAD